VWVDTDKPELATVSEVRIEVHRRRFESYGWSRAEALHRFRRNIMTVVRHSRHETHRTLQGPQRAPDSHRGFV